MPESLQHKLDRVRPPRVQITYDVEIGGAIQKKELPFVVGVLADLSGKPAAPLPVPYAHARARMHRDSFTVALTSMAGLSTVGPITTTTGPGWPRADMYFRARDSCSPLAVI